MRKEKFEAKLVDIGYWLGWLLFLESLDGSCMWSYGDRITLRMEWLIDDIEYITVEECYRFVSSKQLERLLQLAEMEELCALIRLQECIPKLKKILSDYEEVKKARNDAEFEKVSGVKNG